MRPRHKAAENDLKVGVLDVPQTASMRPRHKAAENGDEAAAIARIDKLQ